jgi:hypothetical protein
LAQLAKSLEVRLYVIFLDEEKVPPLLKNNGLLSMQRRVGPNKVGYYGLLQPFQIKPRVALLTKLAAVQCGSDKIELYAGTFDLLCTTIKGNNVHS